MPLAAPGLAQLEEGFLPLFADPPIITTAGAAEQWALAYYTYASSSINVNMASQPFRRDILRTALTAAFNPDLGKTPPGGGKALFLTALTAFWLGTPGIPSGSVTVFVPSGSIDTNVSDDATPQQQAKALADLMHNLTIASAKVLIPPAPAPVPVQ